MTRCPCGAEATMLMVGARCPECGRESKPGHTVTLPNGAEKKFPVEVCKDCARDIAENNRCRMGFIHERVRLLLALEPLPAERTEVTG